MPQIQFGPEWILPAAAFATALATLIYAYTIKRQFYWDKAPIIWVAYTLADAVSQGPNIRNEPIDIHELKDWNARGSTDSFIVAKFRNDQADAMGVTTGIEFNVQIQFKHPTKGNTLVKKNWAFGNFFLMPKEEYLIVIANIRGLDYVTIDITKIRYYDIRGVKHKECHGYCQYILEEGQKAGVNNYRCLK